MFEGATYGIGVQGEKNFAILADDKVSSVFYVLGTFIPSTNGFGISTGSMMFKGVVKVRNNATYTVFTGTPATTSGSTFHADGRSLNIASNGNMIITSDGGINYFDCSSTAAGCSSSIGDFGVLNGNLAIGEIVGVSYDPVSDAIVLGAQDNAAQIQVTGPNKAKGLFCTAASGDGGFPMVDLNDVLTPVDGTPRSSRAYVTSQDLGYFSNYVNMPNTDSSQRFILTFPNSQTFKPMTPYAAMNRHVGAPSSHSFAHTHLFISAHT